MRNQEVYDHGFSFGQRFYDSFIEEIKSNHYGTIQELDDKLAEIAMLMAKTMYGDNNLVHFSFYDGFLMGMSVRFNPV